ncbi:MAG: hypothetical protein JXA18_11630 [Chitinispirillaceae bacterium]|nr:hypothetical protein [Chitinispirillaceae bacterium]
MHDKQVHLSRIINFLIFTQKPISVFKDGNEQQRVLLVAMDLEGPLLKTRLLFPQEHEKIACWTNSVRLNALVRYNDRALRFEIALHSINVQANNSKERELFFSVPDEATIIDRRPVRRLKIDYRENQFQSCIADLSGNILAAPETIELHDVSIAGISVWCVASKIDHERILNDRIKIRIESHGQMVLENTGYAQKTSGINVAADRILIAIDFDRKVNASTTTSSRLFKRMDMKIGALTYVAFHYPFIPENQVFGRVEDLSENGARMILQQTDKPMPEGLFLHNIEIQMPYCEALHIDGIVAYSRIKSTTSGYEQTVGIRFAALRKDIHSKISYITQLLSPAYKKVNSSVPLFLKTDWNVTVRINTLINGKPLQLITHDQLEFSHSHLRINLARTEGLLLPRQILKEILLFSNSVLIANCTGTVETTDFSGENWIKNRCYTVTILLSSQKEIKREAEGHINRMRNRILLKKNDALTYIKADHPLCRQRTLYGHLHDLSIRGMSFYVREATVPIFPGLLLQNFSIHFPFHQRIAVDFFITSCTLLGADSHFQYRIGGSFKSISIEGRNTIALAIQQAFNEHIYEWSEDDLNRLWEFYFESGFIYSKKRRQIFSYSQDIIDTYHKLLKRENPIFKVFLYKQDGDIKGHLSAIHFFDNAWMVQHLMAAKGAKGSIAKEVLDSLNVFFDDLHAEHPNEQNYIFFFYREENTFPAIIFGNIREKVANKWISDSIDLDFCLPKQYNNSIADDVVQHNRYVVREADSSDLEQLEMFLLSEGCIPVFQLEGLNRESIVNLSLESEYERLGLYRYRKVYAAEDIDTGTRCFSVANYSSPGINFSELNNSFRIYQNNKKDKTTAQLTVRIAQHVLNSYIENSIAKPVLLCGTNQTVPPLFEKIKRYKYFYCNISNMALFKSVIAESIQYLKENIRKRHN